jgi:DNA-binding transcriptional LysR family regulator
MHVLPVILDFARQYPLLLPYISFSDSFVDPVDQGVDILVRIGGSDIWPEALGRRYLGAQRLIYCASPAYLAGRGTPKSEADLQQHDYVLYGQTDGMVTPWYMKGAQPGDREGRVMPARIAVGDGEGVVMAVLAGYGIAQLPTWLVKQHLDSGKLIEVLPQQATDGFPMNLVWLKKREALPKVNALLERLGNCLTPSGHQL